MTITGENGLKDCLSSVLAANIGGCGASKEVRPDQLCTGERAQVVDQQLQKLMKQLGEAINESLSDSEQIAKVISKIKSGGYDVFLVLEATIGFNKREEEGSKRRPTLVKESGNAEPELKMSPQDVKFLKSLRISVDGSGLRDRKDRAA